MKPLLLLSAAATAAAAETASPSDEYLIRAGEHGTYSRLLIPNAVAGWSISTGGTHG